MKTRRLLLGNATEIFKNNKIIQQIEELVQMNFDKVVFDSDRIDWKLNTSEFDEIIYGKESAVGRNNRFFACESKTNNSFNG